MAVKRANGESENSLENLSPDIIASMAQAWEKGIDWSNELSLSQFLTWQDSKPAEEWYFLNKYQPALYLADKPPYISLLKKRGGYGRTFSTSRNYAIFLTHHKSETVSFPPNDDPYKAETERTTKLLRGLLERNLRSKLYGGGSVLSFLGSECASWAVDSSTTLAKEFRDKMALNPASIPGL